MYPYILYIHFQLLKLQAAIKYGEEDLAGAKSLVDQCPSDDQDTEINRGYIRYKGIFIVALKHFCKMALLQIYFISIFVLHDLH